MKTISNFGKSILLLTVCLIVPALAQSQEDDSSRRFWPPNFRPAQKQTPTPAKAGHYKRTTPPLPAGSIAPGADAEAVIGVTVWQLRPSKESDPARILVTKSSRKSNWTPQRAEANARFSEGQMIRLSIEAPRSGYLYVIDREEYTDGSTGSPYLIYPLNPGSDENRVAAGRVIEIPNQADDQAYFELKSLREAGQSPQTAELLTILVTASPLTEFPKRAAGDDAPLQLSQTLVEKWEKEWAAQIEQLELQQSAGAAYTKAEQAAGKDPSKRLSQADPLPQTIFRVAVKPGNPLMIKLPLRIKEKS